MLGSYPGLLALTFYILVALKFRDICRNVLGTKCLAEILSEREQIAHWMETTLDEATDPWGVKVERVEM
jgi:regulator of protease activity HflC (stomatin/prohibitin superfamily)